VFEFFKKKAPPFLSLHRNYRVARSTTKSSESIKHSYTVPPPKRTNKKLKLNIKDVIDWERGEDEEIF
jgi:hypothetical protein